MVLLPSGVMLWFTDPVAQAKVTIPPVVTAPTRGEKLLLPTVTVVVAPATSAVNETGDPLTPLALARIVISPAEEPRVTVVVAIPEASVATDVGLTLPPPVTTCQVTVVPTTGSPPSVIFTRRGEVSTSKGRPAWLSPSGAAFDIVAPPPGPVPPPPPPPQPSASAPITAAVPKRCAGVTERHRLPTRI